MGTVWIGGTDTNLEQVRRGYAWAYRKYLKDPAYLDAEASAKNARLGLWSRPDAVPPWEYRHPERRSGVGAPLEPMSGPAGSATAARPGTAPGCGSKGFCKEMASCAEARHYLKACGLSKLDGNGVPCENLCK